MEKVQIGSIVLARGDLSCSSLLVDETGPTTAPYVGVIQDSRSMDSAEATVAAGSVPKEEEGAPSSTLTQST